MDKYEKVGFTCLGIVVGCYVIAILIGMIAVWPYGVVGLIAGAGACALLVKVVRERVANKEDTYYSKSVEK